MLSLLIVILEDVTLSLLSPLDPWFTGLRVEDSDNGSKLDDDDEGMSTSMNTGVSLGPSCKTSDTRL